MPPEGVYDFYRKRFGEDGFGIPTTLHIHRESKRNNLLLSATDGVGNAYLKIGEEWCWVRPPVWDAYNRSILRVEAHRARGFVLGILQKYPCPEPEEFLAHFFRGVKIVRVPKPKLL